MPEKFSNCPKNCFDRLLGCCSFTRPTAHMPMFVTCIGGEGQHFKMSKVSGTKMKNRTTNTHQRQEAQHSQQKYFVADFVKKFPDDVTQ